MPWRPFEAMPAGAAEWRSTEYEALQARWGSEDARALILQTQAAIRELANFCEKEGIDADWSASGWVWGAASKLHAGAWDSALKACRWLNVGDLQELSAEAAAHWSGTKTFVSAVLDKTAALLHPGKLIRGLRAAALRRGVRIYEHTRVRRFSRSCPVRLKTARGAVTADKAVLAINAWAAALPELSRSIVVVSSDIIASAPMLERLAAVHWRNRAGVNDSQQMVN